MGDARTDSHQNLSFPASLGPDLKEPRRDCAAGSILQAAGLLGYLKDVNKRPGQIRVTVETGFCSFCDRTRNLRREERQLGALIRTVIACESCHRVLSSTIGVAGAEEPSTETAAAPSSATPVQVEPKAAPVKKAPAPKPKTAAAKPRAAVAKAKAPATRNRPTK
jgi:hypothetical protein